MRNSPSTAISLYALSALMAALSSCAPADLASPQTPTPPPSRTAAPTATPTPWPAEGSTPEEQGMDSGLLVRVFDYIDQGDLDVHGLLVIRNGHTVLEAYYPPHGPDIRHSTASVGKSVTGALVGIAIREGFIDGVDQKVADFFPERREWQSEPLRQAMTIEHLLTLTSGLDWPEASVPYSSPCNVMGQMMRTSDWVGFVLDRPIATAPGSAFNYSSGASHLLSAIIQKATETRTIYFADEVLFKPLGIRRVTWRSDPQGIAFGAGGIWLTPRELARFGQLYLQGGRWDGRQIVPADWVEASIAPHVAAHGAASHYGYQWWVRGSGTFAAHGYRGQRIFVVPDLGMVVVFTADLASSGPSAILSSTILPAARSPEPLPENPDGVARLEARIAAIQDLRQ